MCDDLNATIEELKTKGLRHTEIANTEFGIKTTIVLPSGGEMGLTSRRTKLRSKAGNRDVANRQRRAVPQGERDAPLPCIQTRIERLAEADGRGSRRLTPTKRT